jgi:hypothetical protein
MGNYAPEYYAEDAVFPLVNQVLDGVFYGINGNNLEGTVVIGGGVGYPAVGDVRLAVVFGESNEFIGTLALPTVGQVQSGVGYGAGGTEFTGTLVGGGGAINVYPISGSTPERVSGTTITVYKDEEIDVTVSTSANLTASTLQFVVEDAELNDVLVIENGDIARTSSSFTVGIPDTLTDELAQYGWTLRDITSGNQVINRGVLSVEYAASKDA